MLRQFTDAALLEAFLDQMHETDDLSTAERGTVEMRTVSNRHLRLTMSAGRHLNGSDQLESRFEQYHEVSMPLRC